MHQFAKFKRFLSRRAVVFAHSIDARCQVENEDAAGAAPTGDAPPTSEWAESLLLDNVCLISDVLRYMCTATLYCLYLARRMKYWIQLLGIVRLLDLSTYQFTCVPDGKWNCPWYLSGFECHNGKFYCDCPGDGQKVHFEIGCCYKFPE